MALMGVPAALSNRPWARLRARKEASSFIVVSKSCRCSGVRGCTYLTIITSSGWTKGVMKNDSALMRYKIGIVSQNFWSSTYEAEIHRLKGALLLQQTADNHAEAESCFHHAINIARFQQAKSFELRAATSLARLLQQQGKRQEAHDLLAPVYHWFTEGFDTADLQDAKAVLEELEDGR